MPDQGHLTSEGASGSGLGPIEPRDQSTSSAAGGRWRGRSAARCWPGSDADAVRGCRDQRGGSTPEIRIPGKKFTCGGCTAQWTGLSRAHCAAKGCHRTFTTASAFDKHRGPGGCTHPSKVGLVERGDGLWSYPAPDPTQREITWRAP